MSRISCLLTLVVLLMGSFHSGWAQNTPKTSPPYEQSNPLTPSATADASQQQANRDDLQQMRALLNQMRTNLAFVGSNTSPLNHQFELEIDMWQMLLERMEARSRTQSEQKPGR